MQDRMSASAHEEARSAPSVRGLLGRSEPIATLPTSQAIHCGDRSDAARSHCVLAHAVLPVELLAEAAGPLARPGK